MKKMKIRLLCILLAAVLAAGITSGCTAADKLALVNSLEKTLKITSGISKSDVRVRLGVTGLPEEEQEMISSLLPLNRDIYLRAYQKVNEEQGGSAANSQMEVTIQAGAWNISTSVWTRVNTAGDGPATLQIVRVPSEARDFLPPDLADKEYMVLDDTGMEGEQSPDPEEYRQMVEALNNFQVKLVQFLKEYAMSYNPDFAVISDRGESVVNGRTLRVYELLLTDKSLKNLIRYTANDLLKNESAKQLLKDLLISMMAVSGGAASQEEMGTAVEKLRDGTESFTEELNKLLEAFDHIRLLGARGLVLQLGIDEEGYLVKQSGYVDLLFNLQEFEKAFRMADGYYGDNIQEDLLTPPAVITMNLDFDFELTNVNEAVAIDFPVLTDENSFNLTEALMKLGMVPDGTGEEEAPAGLILDNEWMDFHPIVAGEVILVPVEDMAARLGANVRKTNEVLTLTKAGRSVSFPLDDMIAVVDGVEQTLEYPVLELDDKTYVPIDVLADILNIRVSRNEFGNVVVDRK